MKSALLLASMALAAVLAGGTALAAAGDLDPNFGDGGKVVTDFGSRVLDSSVARDVAVQPDGRVLVAGISQGAGGYDLALARYKRDGDLDGTFGRNGEVTTDFSGYGSANALVLQPDGKILVAGHGVDSSLADFALARYNANGTLDETFGDGDGKVTTDFGARTFDEVFALVLQPDGKVVAAGSTTRVSDFDTFFGKIALVRYDANGTVDQSFGGGDGKVTTDIGPGDDVAQDLVLEPNGKLVAAGFSARASERSAERRFLLLRYDPDGRLDRSFGEGGKATTGFGHDSGAFGLVREPDNKLVAAGFARPSRSSVAEFALARYGADGKLDQGFGEDGKVLTRVGNEYAYAYDVVRLPSGKLAAAGSASVRAGGANFTAFALARYAPSGALDRGFGTDGRVFTRFGNVADHAQAVTSQGDGRLIAAGGSSRCRGDDGGCRSSFALARYRAE